MTDLDGTAVHEFEGHVVIPDIVAQGLERLRALGRPVILNTLRFPLNVAQTFGGEWFAMSNAPLPLVCLNGSLIGHLSHDAHGERLVFEESAAFPITPSDVEELLEGLAGLLGGGVLDILVFFYPRRWGLGEFVWTPVAEKVPGLSHKYPSAAHVVSGSLDELRARLEGEDICMVFLLIDRAEDELMAYQHSKRSNFITRRGVDKTSGAHVIAQTMGLDLAQAVGAGDTPMDTFLRTVGLAVQVGNLDLEFKGLLRTVKVRDSLAFGALLGELVALHGEFAR